MRLNSRGDGMSLLCRIQYRLQVLFLCVQPFICNHIPSHNTYALYKSGSVLVFTYGDDVEAMPSLSALSISLRNEASFPAIAVKQEVYRSPAQVVLAVFVFHGVRTLRVI